jgi:hypothetical protein
MGPKRRVRTGYAPAWCRQARSAVRDTIAPTFSLSAPLLALRGNLNQGSASLPFTLISISEIDLSTALATAGRTGRRQPRLVLQADRAYGATAP